MVLVGKVQAEINNTFGITITQMNINGDTPVTVKYSAVGPIGAAQGCEKVSASLTFAVPATGLEFDIVGALNSPEGFSLNFPIGAERHALYHCHRSKRGFSNNPEGGDTSFTMDIVAEQWVRIR